MCMSYNTDNYVPNYTAFKRRSYNRNKFYGSNQSVNYTKINNNMYSEFKSISPMIYKTITILLNNGDRILHIVPTAVIPCNYEIDNSHYPRKITFCKGRVLTNYLGCNDKIKESIVTSLCNEIEKCYCESLICDRYKCYCGNIKCNRDCGVLYCGCIDFCRNKCGIYTLSYD